MSDYLEIASDMRALFLATGGFYESPVLSCDVVPVEAAAKAVMATRSPSEDMDGAVGREKAERARWSGLPSVVSWARQVRQDVHLRVPVVTRVTHATCLRLAAENCPPFHVHRRRGQLLPHGCACGPSS